MASASSAEQVVLSRVVEEPVEALRAESNLQNAYEFLDPSNATPRPFMLIEIVGSVQLVNLRLD